MASSEDFRMEKQNPPPTLYSPRANLSEFDEDYWSLIDNAPDIFFVVDFKGKFHFINRAIQKITGHNPISVSQNTLQDLVAPEYRDTITYIFNQAPKGITNPYFEVEVLSANQNKIPLEIHIRPVRDKKGRIAALRGVARDITERKKTEASLQASEEKFSALAEGVRDGIIIVQDGVCRFANRAVREILGYDYEEFQGTRFFEWFPSKDKKNLADAYRDRIKGKDAPSPTTTRVLHKDGSIKQIVYSASLIQFRGRPAEMGIIHDISAISQFETALKKAEEKFQILVEQSNDITFTTDPAGVFTFIGPAGVRHLGYSPEELIGKSFMEIAHPEDAPVLEACLKKTLEGNRETLEFRVKHKEGNLRDVRISCSLLKDGDDPAGILGISTDISEQKAIINKLNEASRATQNAKAQLQAVIDNAPIAIQGFNENGEVLFWNKHSEKLLGVSEADIKGKSLKGILNSESEEIRFREALKNIFHSKRPVSLLEWRIKKNSGDISHILASIYPVILPGQEPMAVAIDMDITEQKVAEEKIREMSHQIERFSEISAAILSIEDEPEVFSNIAKAVVDISDFSRVLISYFIEESPYRKIIAHSGVNKEDIERVKNVEMPREKFLSYFQKGIKIGTQSCYIPHTMKDVLDEKAVIPGAKTYVERENSWHREDNLLVCMKDTRGNVIGMISVDDSKSGRAPTEETVRPLEIFANLISEIIQRRMLSNKIKESEEKYRELVANIQVGVFRANPEGEILEANPSTVNMFGYKETEEFLKLRSTDLFQNPNEHGFLLKEIKENGVIHSREILLRQQDGRTFWASFTATAVRDELGKILYYDAVVEDITERKKLQEEVKRLSVTDELTGLYNRRYFNEKLPMVIKAAETFRSSMALIMVDIDDFKPYNDNYHHLAGDEVIKEIARVIHQNIRHFKGQEWVDKFGREEFAFNDWASRFGGDEFCVVLPGRNAEEATVVAERIRKTFQTIRFTPDGKTVQKTVSLGISCCKYTDGKAKKGSKTIFPSDYEKAATELVNLADRALFKAKKAGKNRSLASSMTVELTRTMK